MELKDLQPGDILYSLENPHDPHAFYVYSGAESYPAMQAAAYTMHPELGLSKLDFANLPGNFQVLRFNSDPQVPQQAIGFLAQYFDRGVAYEMRQPPKSTDENHASFATAGIFRGVKFQARFPQTAKRVPDTANRLTHGLTMPQLIMLCYQRSYMQAHIEPIGEPRAKWVSNKHTSDDFLPLQHDQIYIDSIKNQVKKEAWPDKYQKSYSAARLMWKVEAPFSPSVFAEQHLPAGLQLDAKGVKNSDFIQWLASSVNWTSFTEPLVLQCPAAEAVFRSRGMHT